MNQRLVSVLIFAFVVSAGASVVIYRLVSSRTTTAAPAATSQVIVAAHLLEVGALLKDSDLSVKGWTGIPPKGAVYKKEDVIGRGVIAATYEDEPVLDSRLAPRGAGAGLAATIPPGMRAVAVRVNDVVGVAGFVVPGMRVDLIISGNPPGGNASAGTVAKTVLQNIQVLSAGQNFQKDAEGKPVQVQVVNLLVTPEQAEVLSLASTETRIQLVLRNPLDTQMPKTGGTALGSLFGGQTQPKPAAVRTVVQRVAPPPGKAAPPPPVMVEVFNGSHKVESKFSQPEANQ